MKIWNSWHTLSNILIFYIKKYVKKFYINNKHVMGFKYYKNHGYFVFKEKFKKS